MCPGAKWPSISPIGEINGDAIATPSVERDELAEGREKQGVQIEDEVQDPVQGVPEPPEAHAEVRAPRVARRPFLPTKADIDEHYPLHLNYRSWCDHCVAGKSRLAQHKVLCFGMSFVALGVRFEVLLLVCIVLFLCYVVVMICYTNVCVCDVICFCF